MESSEGSYIAEFSIDSFHLQNGTPSHNAGLLRSFLDNNFSQRWIGADEPAYGMDSTVSRSFSLKFLFIEFLAKSCVWKMTCIYCRTTLH